MCKNLFGKQYYIRGKGNIFKQIQSNAGYDFFYNFARSNQIKSNFSF